MNNVYFPVQVAILLRRLANALSTLSISNQYLVRNTKSQDEQDANAADKSCDADHGQRAPLPPPSPSWAILRALYDVTWPRWAFGESWDWPKFTLKGTGALLELKGGDVGTQSFPFSLFSLMDFKDCSPVGAPGALVRGGLALELDPMAPCTGSEPLQKCAKDKRTCHSPEMCAFHALLTNGQAVLTLAHKKQRRGRPRLGWALCARHVSASKAFTSRRQWSRATRS
jgi:hypothetical protein